MSDLHAHPREELYRRALEAIKELAEPGDLNMWVVVNIARITRAALHDPPREVKLLDKVPLYEGEFTVHVGPDDRDRYREALEQIRDILRNQGIEL